MWIILWNLGSSTCLKMCDVERTTTVLPFLHFSCSWQGLITWKLFSSVIMRTSWTLSFSKILLIWEKVSFNWDWRISKLLLILKDPLNQVKVNCVAGSKVFLSFIGSLKLNIICWATLFESTNPETITSLRTMHWKIGVWSYMFVFSFKAYEIQVASLCPVFSKGKLCPYI